MAAVVIQRGPFTVTVRYLNQKRGVFQYYRRVPQDLLKHYGGQRFIRESLSTRSPAVAARLVAEKAQRDDRRFEALRSREGEASGLTTEKARKQAQALLEAQGLARGDFHRDEFSHDVIEHYLAEKYEGAFDEARNHEHDPDRAVRSLLSASDLEALHLLKENPEQPRVLLSDALEAYLAHHKNGKQERFSVGTRRSLDKAIAALGDHSLETYKRAHARKLVEALTATGMRTRTVRRNLTTVAAVFNAGRIELDRQDVPNPFESVTIQGEAQDAKERHPYSLDQLNALDAACRAKDDDIRHIVAMLIDTGARLAEVVGLRLEDVRLNEATPYIHIRPHLKYGRTLKNKNSERVVPLIGASLWGAQRAVVSPRAGEWLFPRYASDKRIKSDHASATIKKWLQPYSPQGQTAHSFRHSMRDRLTNAGVPREIIDEIGGWGDKTVNAG